MFVDACVVSNTTNDTRTLDRFGGITLIADPIALVRVVTVSDGATVPGAISPVSPEGVSDAGAAHGARTSVFVVPVAITTVRVCDE
jgi:hypothetical protein